MFTSLKVTHLALFTGLFVGLSTGVAAQLHQTQLPASLVSQAVTQVEPVANPRASYSPVSLNQFAQNGKSLTGESPSAIVAQLFGVTEALSNSGSERLEINYSQSGGAIALLTQTGRQDDSVNGVRYRVELQSQPSNTSSQWQVIWVGQQFKCQPGRGHQAWSAALCL
jgi:hypothetical protein